MEQELLEIVKKIVETGMETIPPAAAALELAIRADGITQLLIASFIAFGASIFYRTARKATEEHVMALNFIGMGILSFIALVVLSADSPLVKVISPLGWLLQRAIVGG